MCGECGTPYKRCTWARKGKKRIVWRCVSRLEFGTKYCHSSPTLDEDKLLVPFSCRRIVVLALNEVLQSAQHGHKATPQGGEHSVHVPPDLNIVPAQPGEVSLCQLNTKFFTDARGGQQVFPRPPPGTRFIVK